MNTDAHISTAIGKFKKATAMLEEIHFPEELVMNRNAEVFLENYYTAGFARINFDEEC